MLNKKLTTANVTVKNDENQQTRNDDVLDSRGNQQMATVEWNQQKASTSSWCLELAIAKRCRLNKVIRQRFALAIRFSRGFRDKIQQVQHSRETSRFDDVILSIEEAGGSNRDVIISIIEAADDLRELDVNC
ncbi:hypothetical protein F511_41717 [Dorcoceras hygrometricum]|uniref:Uncharacterized protein n=1 Tax=Dorcoceras hygrometricum TaxID=472368 RepID=A0A2Z7D7I3_9LAMI|nr:hypothetical protein F511_41717 [Dorcoceras hygrometricum]